MIICYEWFSYIKELFNVYAQIYIYVNNYV